MRVLIVALLLSALLVPGVAAESEESDQECTNDAEVRVCFEDYGCDHQSGICRHYTYCVHLFGTANCTYT